MPTSEVLCVILGGGRGSRLWPLTAARAKPAVPIGGKYRLIDIPLSNCLNSGMDRIAVLTQFNSASLNRHVAQTYHFDLFNKGWVQVLAAEQTSDVSGWYQGTADAVRKQLGEILSADPEHVLILAGDHLYRMNYSEMLEDHREHDADITVAVKPVSREEAPRFGILQRGSEGFITDFVEKPKTTAALRPFECAGDPSLPFLASMGIYLFRTPVLVELLASDHVDFGKHILPAAIRSHRIFTHSFHGYWEDIGTIRSFYEANLLLTRADPPFRFHDPESPVYTHPRFLPGCRIYDVDLNEVLLADGCFLEGARIDHSLIGHRSVICTDVEMSDTVMMGADYYESEAPGRPAGAPPIGIGPGTRIRGAIVDKNARIGHNVRIEPFPLRSDVDGPCWSVRDGIVVVPKNAIVPDGTVIAPP
ncbi:MAG: glucose-1-phosphate adenylyltransferase [Planctomycetota bacterium]